MTITPIDQRKVKVRVTMTAELFNAARWALFAHAAMLARDAKNHPGTFTEAQLRQANDQARDFAEALSRGEIMEI